MRAIIPFRGFTETDADYCGTEELYFNVVRRFANDDITTFHPRRWNSPLDHLMGMLMRQRIHEVVLIGYSWGAGYSCMKFAKMARENGITIPLALLCDPVYRPTWMPAILGANPLNIYSLDRRTKIKVPGTIKRVKWVRQNLTIPCGHDLVADSPGTVIEHAITIKAAHTVIDEMPEWHNLVKDELTAWVDSLH